MGVDLGLDYCHPLLIYHWPELGVDLKLLPGVVLPTQESTSTCTYMYHSINHVYVTSEPP